MEHLRRLLETRIFKNFFALVILQAGNYLLPLIMIPVLVRKLGMELFGDWAFATAIASIFRTFVTYGFDLTATRAVAMRRDDKVFISEMFTAVVVARLSIFLIACIAFALLAWAFDSIGAIRTLGLAAMLVLVGEALFPIWLFQGQEQMGAITQIRLAYRALFVVAVILLVELPADVLLVPLLEGAGSLAAGLVAAWLAFRRFGLTPRRVSFPTLREHVTAGFSVFLAQIAVHFYTTINIILLGMVSGPIAVAQYSIAEKVYSAIRGLLGPVVQATFPALSRQFAEDPSAFARSVRKLMALFAGALLVLAVTVFVLSDFIVAVIAGVPDAAAARALAIMALALCFAFGTLLSTLLVIQNRNRELVTITYLTAATNALTILPAAYYFGVPGAACSLVFVQIVHTAMHIMVNGQILRSQASPSEATNRVTIT